MKVLVHDGIGVWLAARRLNSGKFVWPKDTVTTVSLSRIQLDALVLGLPWQRVGVAISRVSSESASLSAALSVGPPGLARPRAKQSRLTRFVHRNLLHTYNRSLSD